MAAATILMAILGCGDAGTACEPVSVLPVRYESVSACVAAQDAALARADVMYPVVVAECRVEGTTVPASLNRDERKPATPRAKPVRMASRG
ncbi:MAG TPA: hypothetical protein VEZ48_08680 [Sphingomonadaceae bacterium]|nr:hypothetical protein [Sphingomonadaceae bacterium]